MELGATLGNRLGMEHGSTLGIDVRSKLGTEIGVEPRIGPKPKPKLRLGPRSGSPYKSKIFSP